MIRQNLKKNKIGRNQDFQYRGEEQTRIETFSDAVFALAITLLIVSNKVPGNFEEVKLFLVDIIPFGLCMVLITYIWYEHYLFFVRYGFKSSRIVILNALLLFSVLLYVFPLKFLAKMLVAIYGNLFMKLFGLQEHLLPSYHELINPADIPQLMIIYGLGFAVIFLILGLMYRYALSKKEELSLNALEIFDTKSSLESTIILGSVPTLSILWAIIFGSSLIGSMGSGFIYTLFPLIFLVWGKRRRKGRKKLSSAKKAEN